MMDEEMKVKLKWRDGKNMNKGLYMIFERHVLVWHDRIKWNILEHWQDDSSSCSGNDLDKRSHRWTPLDYHVFRTWTTT